MLLLLSQRVQLLLEACKPLTATKRSSRVTFGFIIILLGCWIWLDAPFVSRHTVRPASTAFPRKIWQTWKTPSAELEGELQRLSSTWPGLNPSHRYELLTDESAATFVEENFAQHDPEIVRLFNNIHDAVMKADVTRYLILLSAGGVYADIDVHCSRPIEEWVPQSLLSAASLVVGVEYDAQGGEVRADFSLPVWLCQWTFMAKAGAGAMRLVVDRVFERLASLEKNGSDLSKLSGDDVLQTTGPHIFTTAIMDFTGMTFDQLTNVTAPTLFGNVLVLPVSAFGSGQGHSGSKRWGNDEQLVSHHFLGLHGWRLEHH